MKTQKFMPIGGFETQFISGFLGHWFCIWNPTQIEKKSFF